MDVLLPAARALSLDNATREHGLGLYRTLIRFFVEHRTKVPDVEYFGAIPSVLEVAFPLLLTRNIDEVEMGYFVDAAHAVARVDRSFGHDDLRDALIDVGGDNRGAQPNSSSTQIGVSAPVRLESRKISVTRSIFRAYFGVEFFYESMLAILSFLGIKRTGQMTMTTDDIVVASVVRLGKRVIQRTGDSHAIDDLQSVRIVQKLRFFYLAFSLLSLILGGLIGGHLLFVGLRGGDTTLTIIGGCILVLSILVDLSTARLMVRNQNQVRLELTFKTSPQELAVSVDTQSGAALLDAFLANDAQRRELELLDGWNQVAAANVGRGPEVLERK